MKRKLSVNFWILLLILLAAVPSRGQDYYWPLKIKPRLSSHFGDYRAGHWHAGIDITTNARTGYRVYAVSDGYVFRVKTGFWGYGKALYLKLDDGRYAVYGHLQGFSRPLDEYVRKKQMKDDKYFQDLYFSPSDFPVKKGQFIALSGQSGGGAPHLHLEIRDKDNYPINPLDGIFELPDNDSPEVDYLVIKRFKEFGPANYHKLEFLPLTGNAPNYAVRDTIAINNTANFAAAAYDPNGGFNYGVSQAEMLLDGVPIFGFLMDKLNYESGPQIDYVRDNELNTLVEKQFGASPDNDKNVFYRLYIQPDDRQTFYQNYSYPAGLIFADSLGPGTHSLVINFADIHSNSCSIHMYLQSATLNPPVIDSMYEVGSDLSLAMENGSPELEPQVQFRGGLTQPYVLVPINITPANKTITIADWSQSGNYRIRWNNSNGDISPWVNFTPVAESESVAPYADYLDIVIRKDLPIRVNEMHLGNFENVPILNNYYQALIPVPVTNGYFKLNLDVMTDEPGYYVFGTGGKVYAPDSSISMAIAGDDLYGRTIMKITQPNAEKSGGLTFNIQPQGLLFKNPVLIDINPERNGLDSTYSSLYYYSPSKNRWFYIGNSSLAKPDGKTGGGGKFAVFVDKKPPSITRVKPANNSSMRGRTPILSCHVNDNLSGFDNETQLVMTIDNIWVPAEYDIDTKTFAYQVRGSLKPGLHVLRVTAVDNQGNRAAAVSNFTIK